MAFDCIASITLHMFEHDDEQDFIDTIIEFLEKLEKEFDMAEKITVFNSLLANSATEQQTKRLRNLGYSI